MTAARHNGTEFDWPDAAVQKLRAMHADGKTFAEIAAAIGQGVSRNAVIGKAKRLKLPERIDRHAQSRHTVRTIAGRVGHRGVSGGLGQAKANVIIHRAEGRRRAEANGLAFKLSQARKDGLDLADGMDVVLGRKKVPLQFAEDEGVDVSQLVGFGDRKIGHQCAWVHGDPLEAGSGFCGKLVKEASQWCPDHHARVYTVRGQ